jgi:chaperone BCS1
MIEFLREQLATNNFLSGGAFLMVVGAILALLRKVPRKAGDWLARRIFIEVEIQMRDPAFWWFDEWLSRHPYGAGRARSLSARTIRRGKKEDEPPTIILSPAPGVHVLVWRRHLLIVNRERLDKAPVLDLSSGGEPQRETFRVRVLTQDRSTILRLLEEARDVVLPKSDPHICIYSIVPWEVRWMPHAKCRPRPMESVVLRRNLMETMLSRVRAFQAGESYYVERGIPWRYRCLFHGPPGTGKTSAVVALASRLKLDLAVLNLADPSLTDGNLCRLMATVPTDCILLIEDVDRAFTGRDATDDKTHNNKVTFSGLLNAIDGVASGDGGILFMTSNHPDLLDPALVRPGRCDDQVLIDHADADQAERMFLRFFPGSLELARAFAARVGPGTSPADLQRHLMDHAHDATAGSLWPVTEQTDGHPSADIKMVGFSVGNKVGVG